MEVSVEKLRPVEVLWILNRETKVTMNSRNAVKSVAIDLYERELINIDEISDIREISSMDGSQLANLDYERISEPESQHRKFERKILQNTDKRLSAISGILENHDFQEFFRSYNIYQYSNEKNSVTIFGREIYKNNKNRKVELVDRNWKELHRQIMEKDKSLKRRFRTEGDIPDSDVAYAPVFDTVSRWAVDFSRNWDANKGYEMGT